jgi:hypothetical protein
MAAFIPGATRENLIAMIALHFSPQALFTFAVKWIPAVFAKISASPEVLRLDQEPSTLCCFNTRADRTINTRSYHGCKLYQDSPLAWRLEA